jgi:hypothetical protein
LEDTAAVAEPNSGKNSYFLPTYKVQIREMNLILNFASKHYDLNKLSDVSLTLYSVNGLAQNITKEIINQYGEKFPFDSNKKVIDLIKNTQNPSDLNNILSSYSLITNEISTDGLMYYMPLNSPPGTKPVLDLEVIYGIVPID